MYLSGLFIFVLIVEKKSKNKKPDSETEKSEKK